MRDYILRNYLDYFEKLLNILGVSLITLIFLSVMIQIVFRTFFNSPLTWPEEISQFLLIIIVFLGSGLVERQNEQIRVDIAMSLFPKIAHVLHLMGKFFIIVYIISLIFSEIELFSSVTNLKSKAANIPISYIHIFILGGLIFWILFALTSIGSTKRHVEGDQQ